MKSLLNLKGFNLLSYPERLLHILPKGMIMPLEPLTAGLNALAALNEYLCTPAGQKFATDFNEVVGKIFSHLEGHIAPKV